MKQLVDLNGKPVNVISLIDKQLLNSWTIYGEVGPEVEIWECEDCYIQIHVKSGVFRKTDSKEGIQAFGNWITPTARVNHD